MADNVAVTPGTGATIATDDVGGIQVQRVKLMIGADGVNDGDIHSANQLPTYATKAVTTTDTTMQSVAVATGNGVVLSTIGHGTAVINITGTFVGTITFEASADAGTTWNVISATIVGSGEIAATTTTSGIYRLCTAGTDQVRARISAYTSGSITAIGRCTNAVTANKIVKLASSTNAIGKLAANSGVTIGAVEIAAAQTLATVTTVTTVGAVTAITNALPAGTNAIGKLAANSGVTIGAVEIAASQTIAATNATAANFNAQVQGPGAHAASISGNPNRVGARALSADLTAVSAGQTVDAIATVLGKPVIMPYCLPGQAWSYQSPAGGLVSTTPVTMKAAGGAGIKNYLCTLVVTNSHQTIGSEFVVRNATTTTTILVREWCQFAGGGFSAKFDPPLSSIANEALEILEVTATGTAGILVTASGYSAAE